MAKKTKPMKEKKEVEQNPDPHIDQDFPGFPHPPSDIEKINPKTQNEKKLAGTLKKRSEKTYGK